MGTLWQDIRYGFRMLGKNPSFTIVAVLTLALAIGANTSIFSILNAVLLRSLPVPNPHELRVINWLGRNPELSNYTGSGMEHTSGGLMYSGSFPYPAYRDFRDQGTGFSEVFAFFLLDNITVLTRGAASTADGLMVSGNFFPGYGARTLIGRTVTPEDDRLGVTPVAVITYRAWERCYALDPSVLGQTVTINQNRFAIIGVLSREFVGPLPGDPTDFYVPLSAQPQLASNRPLESPNHWWVQIMGRLARGANEAQAQASLEVLFRQVLSESTTKMEQPGIWLEDGSRGPLRVRQHMAQPFWALLALVGLVLAIACANLASLLLVRGVSRRHEMAIRTALGAGRWRLIRQSFTESLMLSLAGAALGLLFALWCKELVLGLLIPVKENLHFDARTDANVLAFTLGLTVVTAVLFGLIPALRAARVDPAHGLKDRVAASAPRLRLGKVLVSIQVGLSILLVLAAGLSIQTFANLSRLDPGFDAENVLLFRLNTAQAGYEGQRRVSFFDGLRESIAAIPGVRAVALSDLALVGGWMSMNGISIPGRSANPDEHLQACQMVVSDSFFSTMGISLLLGRDFDEADNSHNPKVAIVNETFARSFLPDENPVGQTFTMGSTDYRIVGVCRDAKYDNVRDDVPPIMYFAYRQMPTGAMYFEVRSSLPALSLVPAVRKAVAAFDETIPLENIKTQRQLLEQSIVMERLFASLCGSLALLALFLSCVGLYGVTAYTVTCRTSEIGIRMALGATPWCVAYPILREAVLLAAAGVAVGAPAALATARIIRSQLYGVEPHDPLTLAVAAIVLLAVAAFAAWIPARRAAKVDPMAALRYE